MRVVNGGANDSPCECLLRGPRLRILQKSSQCLIDRFAGRERAVDVRVEQHDVRALAVTLGVLTATERRHIFEVVLGAKIVFLLLLFSQPRKPFARRVSPAER